jgi:hypothetical protein
MELPYVDGVSEGQFEQVLQHGEVLFFSLSDLDLMFVFSELPLIQGLIHFLNPCLVLTSCYLLLAACQELKIKPLITLCVVIKRHHIRFARLGCISHNITKISFTPGSIL